MNQLKTLRALAALAAIVSLFGIAVDTAAAGTIVRFDTTLGAFDVELYDDVVPTTVNNFLSYVQGNRYDQTIVHRTTTSVRVIQGGGYGTNFSPIPTDAPIPLEYVLPNERGTLAMARTFAPNSATSQWFINTSDNTTLLGQANQGGYAVFGRVLGDGMDIVDAILALPRYNMSLSIGPPFGELPLENYSIPNDVLDENLVIINSISVVPEPASLAMAMTGLVGVVLVWRKRRNKIRG